MAIQLLVSAAIPSRVVRSPARQSYPGRRFGDAPLLRVLAGCKAQSISPVGRLKNFMKTATLVSALLLSLPLVGQQPDPMSLLKASDRALDAYKSFEMRITIRM